MGRTFCGLEVLLGGETASRDASYLPRFGVSITLQALGETGSVTGVLERYSLYSLFPSISNFEVKKNMAVKVFVCKS